MTDRTDWHVPTVQELDAERERLGLSRSELSRRMGREVHAWSEIVTNNIDPRLSTIRLVSEILDEADIDDEGQPPTGRKPQLTNAEPPGGDD